MFVVDYTPRSLKQLEKIVKKDRAVNRLMERKFTALRMIDFEKATRIRQIKPPKEYLIKFLIFLQKKSTIHLSMNTVIFQNGILTECILLKRSKC